MASALFKDTSYSVHGLVESIKRGDIGLPEIQRPFVWNSAKVRDLLDSMYKGFPIGHFLLWSTGADVGARQIGSDTKEAVPRLVIVDGQQRLTSMFAVITGVPVVKADYSVARIKIAFRPADSRFEVASAATDNDPEFVPDITDVFGGWLAATKTFLEHLKTYRGGDLPPDEEERLWERLNELKELQAYPCRVVELDSTADEEQVAEIFVRINSEGVSLNQSDFILTLMSVWWDKGRRELEEFSRAGKQPSTGGASPFNHFIQPAPDQMLRAAVGLAFRRGRLQTVYSLLRGKDLETGKIEPGRRDAQFEQLRAAQRAALDLTNWHEFLKCLHRAGFRSNRMVSSEAALVYTYTLWLVGRQDFRVALHDLREVIARWFFMAHTTGRYTNSPESAIEADLVRLRDLTPGDAASFCAQLDAEIETLFTPDYWRISLPNRLSTSAAKSPPLIAYWAALNLLDAELLFSTTKVATLLDPGVSAVRGIERHHLFPKHYLAGLAITDVSRINQIANMAFVDWAENATIAASAPRAYWPVMSARVDADRLKRQCYWHALPIGWEQLDYEDFLPRRRSLISNVIREGFESLLSSSSSHEARNLSVTSTADLLLAGESSSVEFKSSARWNYKAEQKDTKLEQVIIKTIAGFMNAEGGALLIGVDDSGHAVGLGPDYQTLSKPNRDGFELFLTQLVQSKLTGASPSLARVSFGAIDEKDICRVNVAASAHPVFARPLDGSKEATEFWVRINNSTRQLFSTEMAQYQREHWE